MEGKWFKSISEFLNKTECTIRIDGLGTPRVQRTNDQCIMDVLRNCQETTRVNRVRIFLQATTIADITDAEGTHISEYAFGGRNSRTAKTQEK
jgi:hypothetical protein